MTAATDQELLAGAEAPFLVSRANGVLSLTFNLPDQGNPIPSDAVAPLRDLFVQAAADKAVRCIVISGRGKQFSTGGDLRAFGRELEHGPDALRALFQERLSEVNGLVRAVLAFDRPVVAMIRGSVAGVGLLFALAADLVLGDETACFLFSHQRLALTPDGGVSFLLPRAVGWREASRLILTAARVDAPEARQLGLLNEIVPAAELSGRAEKLAGRFARAPQRALAAAKRLLGDAECAALSEQLDREAQAIADCVADADFAEGVHAFLERRPASFPSARQSDVGDHPL